MPNKWIILIWTNVCVPGSPGMTEWDLFQRLQEKSNSDQRRELGRSPSFMGIQRTLKSCFVECFLIDSPWPQKRRKTTLALLPLLYKETEELLKASLRISGLLGDNKNPGVPSIQCPFHHLTLALGIKGGSIPIHAHKDHGCALQETYGKPLVSFSLTQGETLTIFKALVGPQMPHVGIYIPFRCTRFEAYI